MIGNHVLEMDGPATPRPHGDPARWSTPAWRPDSWTTRPIGQQPHWPDRGALRGVLAELSLRPSLVRPARIRDLRGQLAAVAAGNGFLLQAGDCAERFESCAASAMSAQLDIILRTGLVLSYGAGLPVVKLGRIAGQYAKPRSRATEVVDGIELPVYRGDIVNGPEATADARRADPERLGLAYSHSSWALDAIREHSVPGVPDLEIFTSHEALLLDYEQALTRADPDTGAWYDTSAHLVWVGDRTRRLDGAHIEFLSGIANPLGVKLGPTTTPNELTDLCDKLDPNHTPGRLVLIARCGATRVHEVLPPLVRAVRATGRQVVWACDPMHGNTIRSTDGCKTRRLDDMRAEIAAFFAVHAEERTYAGGLHLELTAADVTECLGGPDDITERDLGRRYETACDPRLNPGQALELTLGAAELLRTHTEWYRREARFRQRTT